MKKNLAGQKIAFQMTATADGAPVTSGTPTVYFTIDGGTQGTGAGASTHEGNGEWSYAPDQAETDGSHIAFTMVLTNAINQTLNVYTEVDSNLLAINDDTVAATNLELQYDTTGLIGDTFPATQAAVGNLTSGTAAINTTAEAFVKSSTEPETNTFTSTHELDGIYHIVEDVVGVTDAYYEFDITGNGVPVSVTWFGYAQSNGDSYTIWAYNFGGSTFEQVGSVTATNGTTQVIQTFNYTVSHVGTGADLGKVRFRFLSADGTAFATDRLLCSYSVVSQSIGYADGAIWVDTVNGTAGVEINVNGTADNPVASWDNALAISSSLGIKRFHIISASTITLSDTSDSFTLIGSSWTVALGSQDIHNITVTGAHVTGIGTASSDFAHFIDCSMGACTLPPYRLMTCGLGENAGNLIAGSVGDYTLVDCYSLVAGTGVPVLDFSGLGTTSGINNRRWAGGITCILSSNCTLSHEVLAGGVTTITTNGGDAEVRGITEEVVFILSAAETVQFVGITGGVTLSGTTTATVNLNGVSGSLTDTTTAATVSDGTVSRTNINTEVDTALVDYDAATGTELASHDTKLDTLTTQVGTAGAGLSDLGGMSTGMKAEVNAEADQALIDYDAATGTELATHDGKLDTLTTQVGTAGAGLTDLGGMSTVMKAQVNVEADQALTDYDAATGTELASHDTKLDTLTTQVGTAGAGLTDLGGMSTVMKAQVNVEADQALTDYDAATGTELSSHDSKLDTLTTQVGTAGAGLTDLGGMSTGMKTEVNVEAVAAIVANHLDHLLAVDYDPAAKPGVATALLNELIENNAGVSRYTAAALAQAPSGTGGDATEAKQDIIISELGTAGAGLTDLGGMSTGMKAEVNAEADQALVDYGANTTTPPTTGEIWNNPTRTVTGTVPPVGSVNMTFQFKDPNGTDPLINAEINISTDAERTDNIDTAYTDDNGLVTFQLGDGNTLFYSARDPSINDLRGVQFTVVGDT